MKIKMNWMIWLEGVVDVSGKEKGRVGQKEREKESTKWEGD